MKTCWKIGCVALALSPSRLLSDGTSRQPSSVCPSSSTMRPIAPLDRVAIAGVARQEHEARTIRPRRRQRERDDLAQKRVRRLHEDARAVARVGLAAAGPAMLEIDEDLQRLAHDVVRALSLHVDDEADAAGVVLGARIVQTLGSGRRRRSRGADMVGLVIRSADS